MRRTYAYHNPNPKAIEDVMAGLDPDVYRTSAEVAKIVGININRATWILSGIGSQMVERIEVQKPGCPGFTRAMWRKACPQKKNASMG